MYFFKEVQKVTMSDDMFNNRQHHSTDIDQIYREDLTLIQIDPL